ncbi:MAG TPA: hypothetical protein P5067_11330 [Candidatus Marinimicrobia bacterium]|nr:hypothetical protein [Candidatus Neomarinimicrobiota bacterium]HRS53002.1 hypothetical protein [Candidatus Neomarinimicrobiota bacterium]
MELETTKNAARAIVDKIVERFDAYIVDFKVNRQGYRTFVKVLITTDRGIALDQIAEISRAVRDDVAFNELFPDNFQLEVSSPGIDFPLRNFRDFHRNLGREMNVFHHNENLKSPLKGKLESVDEDQLVIANAKGTHTLKMGEIDFAKVIIQW